VQVKGKTPVTDHPQIQHAEVTTLMDLFGLHSKASDGGSCELCWWRLNLELLPHNSHRYQQVPKVNNIMIE